MLMNVDEASSFLKLKKSTIYAWVHQRRIPYVKIGGKLAFSLDKINDFIGNNSYDIKN